MTPVELRAVKELERIVKDLKIDFGLINRPKDEDEARAYSKAAQRIVNAESVVFDLINSQ